MNSITRTTLVLALGLLVWPITATIAGTVDFDFDTDPGWLEVGNRPSDGLGEDFGFSDTGNASGTAGEIGGLVARSGASACAYYGVDLGTILDLDQDMGLNFSSTHAADLFYGVNNGPWGNDTALLGFFNRNDRLVPHPANSVMGVQLSGSDLYTAMFFPGVANSETMFAEALAGGSQYTIRFQYNPSLGASGRLTVEFDGTVTTYDLTADQRASGAQYDTFGFLTLAADGGSGPVELYLDNVTLSTDIPVIPGDANSDQKVNENDASILAANWLSTDNPTWGQGDFNEDGIVNDIDATIMATNWKTGVNNTASVPEPATWLLLVTAMAALLGYRKLR